MDAVKGFAIAAFCVAALVGPVLAAPIAIDVMDAAGKKLQGDPANGEKVFKKCMVCHAIEPGVNKIGPSLHAIIGRQAGSVPKFNYSTANKKSGITWTEQKMFEYLEKPQKMMPGTKMSFPGLSKPQDRADVIAYLQEKSK